MKKKSILLLCALTTFGAFAQKSLVDDVEHQIGDAETGVPGAEALHRVIELFQGWFLLLV
mgnify:CR=1 FL=1